MLFDEFFNAMETIDKEKFAAKCKHSMPVFYRIMRDRFTCGPALAVVIEYETGKMDKKGGTGIVTRAELRPDYFSADINEAYKLYNRVKKGTISFR